MPRAYYDLNSYQLSLVYPITQWPGNLLTTGMYANWNIERNTGSYQVRGQLYSYKDLSPNYL